MLIINTGGTFNKVYDPIKGELIVAQDNSIVKSALKPLVIKPKVEGIIYKDSLEFSDEDRALLVQTIKKSQEAAVVVVHGTDTMNLSAAAVAKEIEDRCVVFTGAMVPFSIERSEASMNLMLAISKALYHFEEGVFIAMQGLLAPFDRVYKDKKRGTFCLK